MEYANRRWGSNRLVGKPGYSPRELARLITTARRDVVGIRDRIQAGEQLLARHRAAPDTLKPAEAADMGGWPTSRRPAWFPQTRGRCIWRCPRAGRWPDGCS
jgi:hypothetical protein